MKTVPQRWLAGFVLLGVVLGLLGSAVICWQYHIDVDPQLIGLHFLALNAGYVLAALVVNRVGSGWKPRTAACVGCGVAAVGLAGLSLAFPFAAVQWRLVLLGILGAGSGILGTALLHALAPYFSKLPAAAWNRAGFAVGCGGLIATLSGATCYLLGTPQLETTLLSVVAATACVLFLSDRSGLGAQKAQWPQHEPVRETLRDLRSVATVLLSLLVFFQFGNEWALAGWLPLFVIHRLGGSPVVGLGILAAYFLALTAGRVVVQNLLSLIQHWKLLTVSTALAMGGCLLLSLTTSILPIWIAVVLTGLGFAPIFSLVAERLDERFSYHSGFYNATSSVAITGAMSAPWLLGFVDAYFGIRYVMLLPAVGSVVVLVLALLIILETHVMGGKAAPQESRRAATAGRP